MEHHTLRFCSAIEHISQQGMPDGSAVGTDLMGTSCMEPKHQQCAVLTPRQHLIVGACILSIGRRDAFPIYPQQRKVNLSRILRNASTCQSQIFPAKFLRVQQFSQPII